MDRQAHLELLLEHYNQPRFREKLPDADVAMPGGNPGCGDVVSVYLKVARPEGQPERIEQVGWIGSGCTISQAAASVVAEIVNEEHPTLDEVLEMSYEDLVDTLGREVPPDADPEPLRGNSHVWVAPFLDRPPTTRSCGPGPGRL